jgi:NAD(P)-dependent dehydrogenase (short-subunit alcohol dehydrogenase family)
MSKKLQGQVAVVTGASKGIGAAIAEHLAAAGAAVVVNYTSSRAGADAVVQHIRQADGKAVAVQADVSKREHVRRLFAETKKAFGKLDILVNNAGIYEFAPLELINPQHFHKQFDLDVLGLLLTTQGEADGFAALYTHNGIIVGATFVAAHAGESLPLLTLAVAQKMTPASLAAVIHCYPTQVEAIQRVADQAAISRERPRSNGGGVWDPKGTPLQNHAGDDSHGSGSDRRAARSHHQ